MGTSIAVNPKLIEELVVQLERVAADVPKTKSPNPAVNAAIADVTKRLLDELAQTPQELASALGVAPATIYRWIKGSSIPRPTQLKRLRALLVPGTDIQHDRLAPVPFYDGLAGFWSADYFFDRAAYAENIYVIRTDGEFLAESDEGLEFRLHDLLEEYPDLLIAYLCPVGQTKTGGSAQRKRDPEDSFHRLKQSFQWRHWAQAAQLQLSPLSSSSTPKGAGSGWRFDLGATSVSTFVIQFNDDGKRSFGRESQILLALPVQGYSVSSKRPGEFEREKDCAQVFIELPEVTTREVCEAWKDDLATVAKSCREAMTKELRDWEKKEPAPTKGSPR